MKKFSILIIDDNIGDLTSLQEMLVANDFEVKSVKNGKEGLKLLSEESFDLIFIAAGMPAKDSFRTCRTIKSNTSSRNTPVIFILSSNDLIFVKDIYESGGSDYILKPLVWSELLMKARIHLELRYSREMSKNMNQILEDKVAQRTVELEESLKKLGQAKKDLELLSVAKSEFLNLISHEIRTPLNGILGSLALIGRYNYSEEVNRYFSLLDKSVKRLEKFSNTILEASTLRIKGAKALIPTETDLVKVIKHALDQCTAKFAEKSIEIILQNDTTNSLLKGDHKYLIKCFAAVLDNAFKFSPVGEKIEISINNETNGFLKITITDHGKGFSKVAMDNIYKPLSNLEAHFDQNTGMGLHIAKLVVDAHSGFITAGNREPKGAIIEIKIPTGI
jgi:two-component system sensor histidine kinase/response regulator